MTKKTCILSTIFILLLLVILGFTLGAYFWFGGYIPTQNLFFLAAFVLSLIGSIIIIKRSWVGVAHATAFFLLAILCFNVSVSLGQVYYYGADNIKEFVELFVHASNRRL